MSSVDLINTTHGPMNPALLRRVDGGYENDTETVQTVEYYLGDEMVHRSVHMHLKQAAVFSLADSASF